MDTPWGLVPMRFAPLLACARFARRLFGVAAHPVPRLESKVVVAVNCLRLAGMLRLV